MTPVHIIGQPGAGKTTLVADLVRHFSAQGLSVGTLKHSSHPHELDKPGKDSHIHRTAGASPAAMVTGTMAAVYFPKSALSTPQALINTYFSHLDLVLIEGWISGPYPKIEIWRNVVGRPPLFPEVNGVTALATRDLLDEQSLALAHKKGLARLPLDRLDTIAGHVLALARG